MSNGKPNSSAAATPYLEARREWNERYGDYLARAYHWRLVALGSLIVSAILAAGLVWQASQSRIVPYIVEVDTLGQAVAVKPVERIGPTDPRVIKAQWPPSLVGRGRSAQTPP